MGEGILAIPEARIVARSFVMEYCGSSYGQRKHYFVYGN